LVAELVLLDNKYKDLYPSQRNWANRAGVSRERANRGRGKFERNEVIQTRQLSGRYNTLNYNLNPILHDPQVRKELATIPAFKECFGQLTIWYLIPEKRTFVKKQIIDNECLITPINICSIMNFNQLNRPLSKIEEKQLLAEKIKATLTPEQRLQIDRYRSGNSAPPGYVSRLVPLTKEQVRDWQPETVGDLLRKRGIVTGAEA
jgi:hypothetical protein